MAAKKKAKKKKLVKKSKRLKKKPATQKKRKAAKRPVVKKVSKPKVRKAVAGPQVLKSKESGTGRLVGRVTHYFPHVNAAVVVVDKGSLKVGDQILIKGHTTHIQQSVTSMEIDHAPITKAAKGSEIGLQVEGRVREHDLVYKVS